MDKVKRAVIGVVDVFEDDSKKSIAILSLTTDEGVQHFEADTLNVSNIAGQVIGKIFARSMENIGKVFRENSCY